MIKKPILWGVGTPQFTPLGGSYHNQVSTTILQKPELRSRPIFGGSGSDPSNILRLRLRVNFKRQLIKNS